MSVSGLRIIPGFLDRGAQAALLSALEETFEQAPPYTPRMPRTGKPMSVRMTNCGPLGWVTDEARLSLSADASGDRRGRGRRCRRSCSTPGGRSRGYPHPPEACLVNFYGPTRPHGPAPGQDEQDFAAPVVSLSLGDTCLFRVGGTRRRDPTHSVRLASGDAVVLGGEGRLAFHGVDRILPGTSTLLPEGGRINLTLRRVYASAVAAVRR